MAIQIPRLYSTPKMLKIWGTAKTLSKTQDQLVSWAVIKAGGYSSIHHHEENYNIFIVINGELKIEIFKNDQVEEIILKRGDELAIPPGDKHRMTAITDVDLIELYYSEEETECLNASDIVREDNGGLKVSDR